MGRSRNVSMWIAVAVALVLLVLSIFARTDDRDAGDPDGDRRDVQVLDGSAPGPDPATGALLVDLDDAAGSADHARIGALLAAAVAPFRWPGGAAAFGAELSDEANLYRIEPPASEMADVLRALSADPDVEGVEVERTWRLPEGAERASLSELGVLSPAAGAPDASDDPDGFRPNDPYYRHQWHLDQIQMPRAWLRTRGKGVVVAVIDTGVLARDRGKFRRAPDLAQTGFVAGWDFVRGDANPDDEHGHGTHVAGTIAQSTHNGIGVAGVAPEARIMPLKVLDRSGSGGWGGIAAAIRWAADHGAHVINMSLGGGMPSATVRRAIDYAHRKGVVIVAAAGNSSRARVEYPAAHAHVIAVGAVRFDETLSFYSCHGRGLDLVAPGGDLRVDQNGDGVPDGVLQNTMVSGDPGRHDYLALQGTSMAAPHVAGVAALVRASGVEDPDAIESILARSAKDLKDERRYAHGLVQADAALSIAGEALGLTRAALAVGLAALVWVGLRRRGLLAVPLLPSAVCAAALAGGLSLLPWDGIGLGFLEQSARGLPGLLAALGGAALAPLALSVLGPLLVAALLLGVRRAGPLVVGAALAFAAFLALEALWPTLTVGLLPGWAVGPFLLTQAALCLLLARLAATRAPGASRAR